MKRPIRYWICFLLLAVLLTSVSGGQAGAQASSTVRVWLNRLKLEDTLRIGVQGTYMLEEGSMTFADGAELTVSLRGDQLVLHAGQIAAAMGQKMTLVRCDGETSGALTLNGSDGLYEGDLHLTIDQGDIRAVLHIYIEDYLLGVVPYEMGDGFPLEALKAQAIAARTYALKRSGQYEDYDVEDTTNDQAYRGRSSSSPLSEQAVRETEGLCGTYKGRLVDCYYSASNGGQTELGEYIWPSDDPDKFAHMDQRDDPFDLENDASSVKRFTLSKKTGEAGVGTALHSALVAALAPQLEALGHEAEDSLVRFDRIVDLKVHTPMYAETSRVMTQMQFDVRVSVRAYTFKDESAQNTPRPASLLPEASPSAAPIPTATPAYSPYKAIDDVLTVTLPIFPTAEKVMGLSINVRENELITVLDIGSAYMVESRRYGHGVGMSQRGAQQMAQKYDMSCEQILSFYYPNMDVMQFSAQRTPMPTANMDIMATPQPTPSPTPRPTLMPVTADKLPRGAYLAVVSNISEDSSLNLRESPSLSAEILRRLYKDQKLIVLKDTSDGWSHVKTDVIEGYVRSEYLQTAEE